MLDRVRRCGQRRVPRERRWLALAALGVVDFLIVLDALAVAAALPIIQAELSFSRAGLQWVVTAYGLTFGGFLLLAGRAADYVDRRRLLVAGFTLFALASLLGGLAPSAAVLIGARALQGLGAAICAPTALAVLAELFEAGRARSRALAVWSVIGSFGLVAGAVVGGLVTAGLGWRWILLLNVPLGVVGIAAICATIPVSTAARGRPHLDLAGALTVTTGVAALIYAATQVDDAGPADVRTVAPLSAAVALLIAFVFLEVRADDPLVPLGVLGRRPLAGANLAAFLLNGAFGGALFLTTLYLQQVLQLGALKTGLAFLPLGLATVVGGPLGSRLTNLLGYRLAAAFGLAVMACGMGLLATVSAEGTFVADVLPGTVLVGLGVSAAYVPMTAAAVDGVGHEAEGLASGLYQTTGQVGGALVLAVLAVVSAAVTSARQAGPEASETALASGFSVAFLLGAALLAGGVVVALALLGGRRTPAGTQRMPS